MGSSTRTRNKLLNMYHNKLKRISYEAYKIDRHLLHVLFDQYHRAMQIFDAEKKAEDKILVEYGIKKKVIV